MDHKKLWDAVERRRNRFHSAKSMKRPAYLSPDYFVDVIDKDGNIYEGRVVAALAGSKVVETTTHINGEKTVHTYSYRVPEGFKLNTIGGTVVFDMAGKGVTKIHDHNGVVVRELDLTFQPQNGVRAALAGPAVLSRMKPKNMSDLGHVVAIACEHDPDLRQRVEDLIESHREFLADD